MTHTKEQEAFNVIKRTIDLSLQSGVIKSIEDSKLVFDSLGTLYSMIDEVEKTKELIKQKDLEAQKERNVHNINM